jgi:hypothetical protein
MRKTRKNQPSNETSSEPCCEATYHGITEWYKAKFEKLGWMILAKKNGMMDKVMEYQNSIKRLHVALEQKIRKIHDKDKKADLILMKKNIEVLLEHVKADFA